MSHFDEHGDLWIEVEAGTIPQVIVEVRSFSTSGLGRVPGTYTAVSEMNLTRYIRDLIANQTGAVP